MQDDLTPEELAELQSLEAEFNEAPLSVEEQRELAALEGNPVDIQSVTDAEVATQSQEDVPQGEFGPLQGVADAALSLGNRIPGAKQLSAAVGSVLFDESFDQSLAENNVIAEQAKKRSPVLSTVGEVVADGALIAGGGVALKGAGLAAGVAARTAAVGGAVAADLGITFSQNLSNKESISFDGIKDSATDAAVTATLGLVTGGALASASKMVPGIKNRILALNSFKNLESVKDQMSIRLTNTGQSQARFFKTLKKAGLGEQDVIDNPALADNIIRKTAPNKIGSALDAAYTKLDADKVKVDTTNLYQSATDLVEEFTSELPTGKLTPSAERAKNAFINKLGRFEQVSETQTVFVPNESYTVKDLWEARRMIDTHFPAGKQKSARDRFLAEIEGQRKSILNKAAKSGDDEVKALVSNIEELSMDYGNLKFLQGQIGREGASKLGDQGKSLVSSYLKNLGGTTLFSSGSVVGAIGFAAGGLPGAASAIAAKTGVETLLDSPKALSKIANLSEGADQAALQYASRISAATSQLMDMATAAESPTAATMISEINAKFAQQDITEEEIHELTELTISTSSLLSSPLERTAEAFKQRSADILRIVKKVNPSIANQLVEMIKSGEDVGPVMEQIANQPEARELIQPGQGWEGKTYDPATRESITNELMKARSLPTAARMEAIKQLNADGTIPQMEQLPQREPVKYNPRDKKKERF